MKAHVLFTLTASAMLTASMTGCGTTPTVARGQGPSQNSAVEQASYGTQPHIGEAVHDYHRDNEVLHFNNAEGKPATYPRTPTAASYPSHDQHNHDDGVGPPASDCPHCKGHPPAGQPCPFCQQGVGGYHGSSDANTPPRYQPYGPSGRSEHYPNHYFSYSYKPSEESRLSAAAGSRRSRCAAVLHAQGPERLSSGPSERRSSEFTILQQSFLVPCATRLSLETIGSLRLRTAARLRPRR